MNTSVCVHVGAIGRPVGIATSSPFRLGFTPLRGLPAGAGQLLCEGDSFIEWGESADALSPLLVPRRASIDLEVPDEASNAYWDRLVPKLLTELDTLVRHGWRVLDYVVVTDAYDHSLNARTIGRWGA